MSDMNWKNYFDGLKYGDCIFIRKDSRFREQSKLIAIIYSISRSVGEKVGNEWFNVHFLDNYHDSYKKEHVELAYPTKENAEDIEELKSWCIDHVY